MQYLSLWKAFSVYWVLSAENPDGNAACLSNGVRKEGDFLCRTEVNQKVVTLCIRVERLGPDIKERPVKTPAEGGTDGAGQGNRVQKQSDSRKNLCLIMGNRAWKS